MINLVLQKILRVCLMLKYGGVEVTPRGLKRLLTLGSTQRTMCVTD